jgi:hypothetical protein
MRCVRYSFRLDGYEVGAYVDDYCSLFDPRALQNKEMHVDRV